MAAGKRKCAHDDCETILSRFNSTRFCSVHERLIPPGHIRNRGITAKQERRQGPTDRELIDVFMAEVEVEREQQIVRLDTDRLRVSCRCGWTEEVWNRAQGQALYRTHLRDGKDAAKVQPLPPVPEPEPLPAFEVFKRPRPEPVVSLPDIRPPRGIDSLITDLRAEMDRAQAELDALAVRQDELNAQIPKLRDAIAALEGTAGVPCRHPKCDRRLKDKRAEATHYTRMHGDLASPERRAS